MGRRRAKAPAASGPSTDLLRFLAAGGAAMAPRGADRVLLTRSGARLQTSITRLQALASADLIAHSGGTVRLTEPGRARLRRDSALAEPFLAQHAPLSVRAGPPGTGAVLTNDAESPLAWLARRRRGDGRPLIDAAQLAAGERLRTDFTRAGLTPRVTANWIAPVAQARRAAGSAAAVFAHTVLTAKERLAEALDAVGPEFSGLLLDVCCFLKGLELVERERRWPPRTAKIVLGLGLDRLARHYGLAAEAHGPARGRGRVWQAADARPTIEAG